MIKLKKKQKRKNPKLKYEIEEILSNFYPNSNDIKIEYIDKGLHAHTFKIKLDSKKIYNNTVLFPDTYVLKTLLEPSDSDHRLDREVWKPITIKGINRLKILSKYGLIPKIYYIDKYVIIMKYINGVSLQRLLDSSNKLHWKEYFKIINRANELRLKWKELGFQHGDLHDGNILITNSGKIYFIDPRYEEPRYKNADEDLLNDLKNEDFILEKLDFSNIK